MYKIFYFVKFLIAVPKERIIRVCGLYLSLSILTPLRKYVNYLIFSFCLEYKEN